MSYFYDPETGEMDKDLFYAWKAAKNYDDRLVLKFNPEGQDYVMYVKTDMSDGMPRLKAVLGFGKTCPTADEVVKTLYNADGWKHGDRVLKEMDAREATRKKNNQWLRNEVASEAAERIEKVLRDEGKSPIVKSLPK
jgi:hypothetical protein